MIDIARREVVELGQMEGKKMEKEKEQEVIYAIFWMKAYGKDWRKKREEELKRQREKMCKSVDYKP